MAPGVSGRFFLSSSDNFLVGSTFFNVDCSLLISVLLGGNESINFNLDFVRVFVGLTFLPFLKP